MESSIDFRGIPKIILKPLKRSLYEINLTTPQEIILAVPMITAYHVMNHYKVYVCLHYGYVHIILVLLCNSDVGNAVNSQLSVSRQPEFSSNWQYFKEHLPFPYLFKNKFAMNSMFTNLTVILPDVCSRSIQHPPSCRCHQSKSQYNLLSCYCIYAEFFPRN